MTIFARTAKASMNRAARNDPELHITPVKKYNASDSSVVFSTNTGIPKINRLTQGNSGNR